MCYPDRVFREQSRFATATKFRQKLAKIAHISVLYKILRFFCMSSRVLTVGEFKHTIGICKR